MASRASIIPMTVSMGPARHDQRLLEKSDYDLSARVNGQVKELSTKNWPAIRAADQHSGEPSRGVRQHRRGDPQEAEANKAPILGITGTGGSGKAQGDELIRRFILDQPTKTIGVISVDPSKRKTGGALLGDRIV